MANVSTSTSSGSAWSGGVKPFAASYGKLMMWFFLMSDAFTFSTLLIVYGTSRFSSSVEWANPDAVYSHFPLVTELFHLHPPLAFVGLMTFILIASSVTMVLAVEAGHRMDKKTVEKFMVYTIIGGAAFVACQAYEWYNFIVGSAYGGVHLADGTTVRLLADNLHMAAEGMGAMLADKSIITPEIIESVKAAGGIDSFGIEFTKNGQIEQIFGAEALKTISDGLGPDTMYFKGANLQFNEYSQNPLFANLFFFITGFHGSHVASGVLINFIIYMQVKNGVMERRGHYEMVEKVGLYWHFVDLVWVFVFTLFYLV